MGANALRADRNTAEEIGVPLDRIDEDGAARSETEVLMREILTTLVATPAGMVRVLREDFGNLQGDEDYFVPDNARWEVALLLRSRGQRTSEIAKYMGLPVSEVLHWFHRPGIVQDLYSLMENEEWERLKIRTRDRAFDALSNPETSASEAVSVVRSAVDLFRPVIGQSPTSEMRAAELLDQVMGRNIPLPKG